MGMRPVHRAMHEPPSGLIELAAQGDRGAQQSLLEGHYDFVRHMLYRLLGPSPDLEDLQQTVLMRVVTSLPRFRGGSRFSTWIGGICVHVVKDHFRRRKVRQVVGVLEDSDLERGIGQESVDPERLADARGQLAKVQTALASLSSKQSLVFILHVVEGYSVDEVAAMTNAARSTTRMRLYYGRKAFFKALRSSDRVKGETP